MAARPKGILLLPPEIDRAATVVGVDVYRSDADNLRDRLSPDGIELLCNGTTCGNTKSTCNVVTRLRHERGKITYNTRNDR